MVKQASKVPALRFPEFSGEWEEAKLSTLATIKYGKDQKQVEVENGKYPILGTGGEMGRASQFLYDKPSVLIGRKGTIDKPKLITEPFWTVDTLFYTEISDDTSPEWFYNKALTINWYLYNEASGVPSLSAGTINKIKIFHPTLPEQEKIADFLGAADEKIQQLTRKKELLEQYKKGVMQRIFSQELRFKDDDGNEYPDWEEKRLGDVADVRDGTHDSPKYHTVGYPLITSKNLLSNGNIDFVNTDLITETDFLKINGRSKVDIGDILFGMIGTIGNPVLVKTDGFAIKNVALIKPKSSLKNYFLIHFLKSNFILKQFHKENTGGTQKFLSLGVIRNLSVVVPPNEEQQKIANFLSALDDKIHLATTQLDKAKEFKKGLLQKMFV